MKFLNLTMLIVVFTMAGCQKDVQQQSSETASEESMANARATAPGNAIYLSVAVEDDLSNVNKIRSDNGTPYVNGRDRVDARFLNDGNFYMNTNNNTVKIPLRNLNVLPNTDVNLSGVRNYSLRTAPLDPATKPIYDLAVGESQYMSFRVWGLQQSGILQWKLLFRNGDTREDPLTEYVKVTKTGLNPDTWTIEPANLSSATNAKLEDAGNVPMGAGYYQVPFKLTLTRIGK